MVLMVSDVNLHDTASTASFYLLLVFFDALHLVFSAVHVEQTGTGESSTVFQAVVAAFYLQVFWLMYSSEWIL